MTEIGEGAFENCMNLDFLSLQSNLKRIGNRAFKACRFSGGLTIPNSVTEIGDYAFYECNSFNKDLILSENLKKSDLMPLLAVKSLAKETLPYPTL